MVSLSVETGTGVVVRDGTRLEADVLRPSRPGRYPGVLFRTPYDRTSFASVSLQVHALRLAEAGYAVVLQDVRGRFGSSGRFEPFVAERADGVDTVHWMAEQAWCNGKIGTVGISYNAFSQLATATAAPEPLAAWIPGLTPFDVRTSWIREGGAFNYGFHLAWMLGSIAPVDHRTDDPEALTAAFSDPEGTARRGPADQPELRATRAGDAYFSWLAAEDPYPGDERVPGSGDLGGVRAPALVVAGLFDVFAPGSFELFEALQTEAGHLDHGIVSGPWDHSGLPFQRRAGDRDHGIAAAVDYHALQLSWLDVHLRGETPPAPDRIQTFVTGAAAWHGSGRGLPTGATLSFDLNADGTMGPPGNAGEVAISLDAEDPTPALGGRCYPWEPMLRSGSFDQRPRENRPDVAVFTTEPLDAPLRVIGPASIETVVVPETGATDVVATLCDVDASGSSWNVADGVRRVDGGPGEAVNTRVSLGRTVHEFAAGHRIRGSLSVASFPRYEVYGGSGRRVFLAGPGYSKLVLTEGC